MKGNRNRHFHFLPKRCTAKERDPLPSSMLASDATFYNGKSKFVKVDLLCL